MRRLSIFSIIFFMMAPAFSQVILNDSAFRSDKGYFQQKKIDYGVTLGSQFTSTSGFGSGLTTYVTPHVSYNLNRRLNIGGGISIIQTNYFKALPYFQNEKNSLSNGNFTNALIFVDGQYIINERLTIYGSAFKQLPISKDPLPYNPFNPVSSKGGQGINFNVGYKIGDHMYIQAGFRYSQGVNPIYSDPFDRTAFPNNPFGSQTGFATPRW